MAFSPILRISLGTSNNTKFYKQIVLTTEICRSNSIFHAMATESQNTNFEMISKSTYISFLNGYLYSKVEKSYNLKLVTDKRNYVFASIYL